MQHERYVRRIAESMLPTRYGNFRMIAYSSDVDSEVHVALVRGELWLAILRRLCAYIRIA